MIDFDVSKIKVVFMDIGGVLLTNGWDHESREKASKVFGFDYTEMNILHNFIYNVFEIGSISLDEYLDTVLFHHPRDFSKVDFKQFMLAESLELPEMLEWSKSWKEQTNLAVFALSTESEELNDYRIKTFKLHDLFDGFFPSCYFKCENLTPEFTKERWKLPRLNPKNVFI